MYWYSGGLETGISAECCSDAMGKGMGDIEWINLVVVVYNEPMLCKKESFRSLFITPTEGGRRGLSFFLPPRMLAPSSVLRSVEGRNECDIPGVNLPP